MTARFCQNERKARGHRPRLQKENVMKSILQLSVMALISIAVCITLRAQGTDYTKIEFTAKKVSSNLYMLSGSPNVDVNHPDAAGGLVGILTGPDGIFM